MNAEAKWVDLSRFGASLELVNNPTHRTRRLRLVISERKIFQDTFAGKPWAQQNNEERIANLERFRAALTFLGLREDHAESQARYIAAGGADGGADWRENYPPVFYSDSLSLTNAALRALIPDLKVSDFVSTATVNPNGAPYEWISGEAFQAAARESGGIHFRISDAGAAIACGVDEVPAFYVPAGVPARFDRERQPVRRSAVVCDEAAWDAFQHVESGILEAWTSAEACVKAMNLDPADAGAVRQLVLPYSVPLVYREATRSVLMIPDARYERVELKAITQGTLKKLLLEAPRATSEKKTADSAAAWRETLRSAMRQALEGGLYYSSDVNQFIFDQVREKDVAQAIDLGEFEEPEDNEGRHALSARITEAIKSSPRGSWACTKRTLSDGQPRWNTWISAGKDSLVTIRDGFCLRLSDAVRPSFEQIHFEMVSAEAHAIRREVESEIEAEKNGAAMSTLLANGLEVGNTFKKIALNGSDFESVRITAIHQSEGVFAYEATTREKRRRAQTQGTVAARQLCESLGVQIGAPGVAVAAPAAAEKKSGRTSAKPKRSAQKDETKHEDVGEKIGGARKDFYAHRLTVADLAGMNDLEKIQIVNKKNIWPTLDYEGLRKAGVEPQAAYALKWLKDHIATGPTKVEDASIYIQAVGILRDEFEHVKTMKEFAEARQKAETRLAEIDPSFRYYSGYHCRIASAVGKNCIEVLNNDYRTALIAKRRTEDNTSWARLIKEGAAASKAADPDAEKFRPMRPHLAHLRREGRDWRKGQDITGDDLLNEFGFRGIEYGNWLPQDERQTVLNFAYDAFKDMQQALGLPAKAMSFGGKLALAFGARGIGRYAAHFEPARFVVNLTRIKGAGSLAHEWAHALDRWLAIQTAAPAMYLSNVEKLPAAAAQQEWATSLHAAMAELVASKSPIEEGVKRAARNALTQIDNARSAIEGFATYDHYTGFTDSDKNKEPYIASVKAVLEEVLGPMTEDALMANPDDLLIAYGESDLIERIKGLYSLFDGPKKTFRSALDKIGSWDRTVQDRVRWISLLKDAQKRGELYDFTSLRGNTPTYRKQNSKFFTEARSLDARRKKPYYSLAEEIFARAFESYVFDKIAHADECSDYLVHSVSAELYADRYAGNPYPTQPERDRFNHVLDKAVETLGNFPWEASPAQECERNENEIDIAA